MSDVERVGSTTKLTVSSSYSRAILWLLVLKDSCVSTRVSILTWLSVKQSCSLSGTKTYPGTLIFSTGAIPYFWVHFFFAFGVEKVAKTVLLLSWQWMHPPSSLSEEYEYPALEARIRPAVILVNMMVVVAPATWARARPRSRAQRRSWTRSSSFSRWIASAQLRGLVIMHGLVALFLGVIAFCNHPSCRRTWNFSSPCPHVEGNRGADPLDDDSQVGDHCNRVGCFDDGCGSYDCHVDGSSIHGYAPQEDDPFSFLLATFYPWRSYQEHQLPC